MKVLGLVFYSLMKYIGGFNYHLAEFSCNNTMMKPLRFGFFSIMRLLKAKAFRMCINVRTILNFAQIAPKQVHSLDIKFQFTVSSSMQPSIDSFKLSLLPQMFFSNGFSSQDYQTFSFFLLQSSSSPSTSSSSLM